MTPEEMAEAFERARYEQLRSAAWTDLREGERTARIDVARQAFDAAGITARFETLQAIAQEAELQAGALAQRDAEIARRRAEHEEELAAVRAEREQAVEQLEARCEALRVELEDARTEASSAEARAVIAEAMIIAVRAALSGVEPAAGAAQPSAELPSAELPSAEPSGGAHPSGVVVPQQPTSNDGVQNEPTHRPDAPAGSGGRRLPRLVRAGAARS